MITMKTKKMMMMTQTPSRTTPPGPNPSHTTGDGRTTPQEGRVDANHGGGGGRGGRPNRIHKRTLPRAHLRTICIRLHAGMYACRHACMHVRLSLCVCVCHAVMFCFDGDDEIFNFNCHCCAVRLATPLPSTPEPQTQTSNSKAKLQSRKL